MGKSRDDNFDQNRGLCRDYTGAGARICWFGELYISGQFLVHFLSFWSQNVREIMQNFVVTIKNL